MGVDLGCLLAGDGREEWSSLVGFCFENAYFLYPWLKLVSALLVF